VIKAQTSLVLVDAVVTDKKGNYVHDLTAKDFRLWEDDKEQPIKTFSVANSSEEGEHRYMVLLFDNSNVTPADQKLVRAEAAKFVEGNASPGHYIAVLDFGSTLNVAQTFTTDAQRLKEVVLNDKFSSVSANRASVQIAPVGPAQPLAQASFNARVLLLAIRGLARRMAPMPGRKSLILLSPGFQMSSRELPELMDATDACNKANVAVYPVALRDLTSGTTAEAYIPGRYDRGAYTPPPKGAISIPRQLTTAPSVGNSERVLDSLAQDTGGFVIEKMNDLSGQMDRVAKDQSQYYVLGYAPDPSPLGTCHSLRVKVERGGTEVRSRSGYCNLKSADPLEGKPIERQLEVQASGETSGNITASMLASYFYASPNVARVELAIDIPPGAVAFIKQKGRLAATIDILGLAYKPDGTVAARFSDSVPIEFDQNKDVEEFKKQTLHYTHEFEAAPGSYDLKVAFATGKESFAKLSTPLVIAPYDGKQIAISGIALSKEVHPVPPDQDLLGGSLLEDRTPLVSHGFEFVPSGSDHFKKDAPAALYVEVYDPRLMAANPPQLQVQVKVIDVKTGAAKVDAGGAVPAPKSGSPIVPLGLKIPLETLSPGTYRLEVGASDSAGNTTGLRTTEFVVD
jgi:VWFA-related protein